MGGRQLAVDDRDAVAQTHRDQVGEGDLRGVPLAAEHRFAEKNLTQADSVESPREFSSAPGLDAMSLPEPMQPQVGVAHLRGDPGSRGMWTRRRAGVDDGGEV